MLLPFGGGNRVCLGRALAEAEIRLLAVGMLQCVDYELVADQDHSLAAIPSPTPSSGLQVRTSSRGPRKKQSWRSAIRIGRPGSPAPIHQPLCLWHPALAVAI